ncbi:MAG: hypothetical protein AB2693_12560 [Candidatus Thiodiazotropha sp.]
MAAGDNLDINGQLREVLSELRNQREQVESLKEEFQGSAFNVAAEVKKLKTGKDLNWKYQGNKIQFEFNNEIDEIAKQTSWAVEHGKIDYCKELLKELTEKLRKRNKLIRIADSSAGGWDTVRLYEANPIASDSDDESKIYRAENRALKRKRSSSRGKTSTVTSGSRTYDSGSVPSPKPWGTQGYSRSTVQPTVPAGRLFRAPYGTPTLFPAFGFGSTGPCFACGEYNHIRRQCPHVNRLPATKNQPANKTDQ